MDQNLQAWNHRTVKKLLIIHQGSLGDFIMTFPALSVLRRTYPQVDAICQGKLGELVQKLGSIRKSYALESSIFAALYGDFPTQEAKQAASILRSYEQVVLFSFSQKLTKNLTELLGCRMLQIPPRPEATEKVHVSQFLWGHLVKASLIDESKSSFSQSFSLPGLQQATCRKSDSLLVLVHPGSGSPKKNWPLNRFIALERLLSKIGLRSEFILGPAERDLELELVSACAPHLMVHRVDSLLEALRLLNGACAFIGNDSGLTHLAAVIGLPVTALFGPSDPDRWKPLGPAVAVVHPKMECDPCFESGQTICHSSTCLETILPETVYETFCRLLKL